jgi:flavin reductase
MEAGPDLLTRPVAVSGDRFRALMRNVASSVAVITTHQDGRPHGMTATAVCAVSADPAMLLIVVNRGNRSHGAISATGAFCVNMLAEHQAAVAGRFAGKLPTPFDGVAWHLDGAGQVVIDGAAAVLSCRVATQVEADTHTVFFGTVTGGEVGAALPLLYHQGAYAALAPAIPAMAPEG